MLHVGKTVMPSLMLTNRWRDCGLFHLSGARPDRLARNCHGDMTIGTGRLPIWRFEAPYKIER